MSGMRPYANVVVKDTSGVNQAGRIGLVLEPPQFVLVCYRRGPPRILSGSGTRPLTAQRRRERGQTPALAMVFAATAGGDTNPQQTTPARLSRPQQPSLFNPDNKQYTQVWGSPKKTKEKPVPVDRN